MPGLVYYGKADVLAEGTNADIDSAEEDIVILGDTDQGGLSFSQLSMYLSVALGTHTQMVLRVYCRGEKNGNWYQLMRRNRTSGLMEGDTYVFDASTPSKIVADLPISACFALKVTGQGVGGANGTATGKLLGRSN